MIIYLDAGALVKKYVAEPHSADVVDLVAEADISGTSLISRSPSPHSIGSCGKPEEPPALSSGRQS